MALVEYQQCDLRFSESYCLRRLNLRVEAGQHWVLLGKNGAGKSALAAAMAGAGLLESGARTETMRVELVSFETQREMIEAERDKDDSDITDEVFAGTPVQELLESGARAITQRLVAAFGLQEKLDRGFRQLSTGETRKVLLTRAIASQPELLILDEPYDGLDTASAASLNEELHTLAATTTVVLVLNRLDEVPVFITHGLVMVAGEIAHQGSWAEEKPLVEQLLHLQRDDLKVPAADSADRVPGLAPGPLVELENGRVAYGEQVIFSDLDWQVNPQEHWQVVGPNGSGKTCLLNLITGDHPQCYVNRIKVVGYQRGSGESIWDIKQHIGYVSSALQWEYRVSISLLNVIISGFYDSIGLYSKATDSQQRIAREWLELLGLADRANEPFNQCSYGDQRLLLIARAMVKHPQLLILDEPCLGLDEINRHLVLGLIETLCHSGETTILYVNHHAEDRIPSITNLLNMADYH